MFQRNCQVIKDENGFSLIEILVAVVLLGSCFMLLATLIHQNALAIQLNKRKEEAAYVREDIKEWLLYKRQIQDLADLNRYVFAQTDKNLTTEQEARRGHLILDNTGIQKDSASQPLYGEMGIKETDSDNKRGNFVPKVIYHLDTSEFLPTSLQSATNQLYIGEYVSPKKEASDFLVEVQAKKPKADQAYNARTNGIDLTIMIYDKKTGSLLTSTVLNWVVEG